MLRNLGGRYQAIKSPWPDYAIYSLPDASRIEACDRQSLMDAMNGIIAVNWQATEPHWTAISSPFDRKYSLILVYDGSALVAFSVYRILQLSAGPGSTAAAPKCCRLIRAAVSTASSPPKF